jgi:hypothetical protein
MSLPVRQDGLLKQLEMTLTEDKHLERMILTEDEHPEGQEMALTEDGHLKGVALIIEDDIMSLLSIRSPLTNYLAPVALEDFVSLTIKNPA